MLFKSFKPNSKPRAAALRSSIDPLEGRRLFTGLAASYFARTNLTGVKYAELDSTINYNWTSGTPKASLGTDGFSVRWDGSILSTHSGTYTFLARNSGGVQVWINDQLVISAAGQHDYESDSGRITLKANTKYNIRVDYTSNGTSDPQIQLLWSSSSIAKSLVPASRYYPASISTKTPAAPTKFRATFSSESTAKVMWTPASDSNIVGYDVYVGSTKVATTLASQDYYTRSNLTAGTNYTFSVESITAAGTPSKLVTTAVVTSGNGNQAPGAPSHLSIADASTTSLTLSWTAATDDASGVTYRVYRNGTKLNVAPSGTSFTDTGLTANTTYSYQVRAVDAGGLTGNYSNTASGTTSGAVTSRSALTSVSAASYNGGSGISKTGNAINSLDNGDYAVYQNLDFGSGVKSVVFNVAAPTSVRGGSIEMHLDSTGGQLIGTLTLQPTGNSSTFFNEHLNVSTVSGEHDLYLVFRNQSYAATLNSFVFSNTHLTQVMALGDSITQESGNSQTWRYYLQQQLNGAGITNYDFVGSQIAPWTGEFTQFNYDQDNEGHAGYRADEVADDVTGWASANVPDIVLLHVGTNDIKQGQDVASTLSDITRIIQNLRSVNPNVKIALSEVIPLTGFEAKINQLNAGIVSVASSQNVTLVNNSGVPESDLYDGIHPNDAGDQIIASNFYNYLSSILS